MREPIGALAMTKVQAPGHVALQQMVDDNLHCWWATQIDHDFHMYSLFARHVRPEFVSAYSLLITTVALSCSQGLKYYEDNE